VARPVGSVNKPKIASYIGLKDMEKISAKAIELAKGGDSIMIKFLMEQYFGKAVQPISGEKDGEKLAPILVKFIDGSGKNSGKNN